MIMYIEELKYDIMADLQAINNYLKESGDGKHELKILHDAGEGVYFIDDHNVKRSQKKDLVTMHTMVSTLRKSLECNEPLRICSVCGNILLFDGYVEDMGSNYYCSDECLHTQHTDEEWKQMCEDNDQTYWTEWNY